MKISKLIVLVVCLSASACTDEVETPTKCYLSKITITDADDNITVDDFTYNDQQQLIRDRNHMYEYDAKGKLIEDTWVIANNLSGGDCKIASKKFTYLKNEIIEEYDGLPYGGDGCPQVDGVYSYTYNYYFNNNKLVSKTKSNFQLDSTIYVYTSDNITLEKTYIKNTDGTGPFVLGEMITYEYDTKRNPWHIYKQVLTVEALSKNNITKITTLQRQSYDQATYSEGIRIYAYTYSSDGYPLTREGRYYNEQFEYFCNN